MLYWHEIGQNNGFTAGICPACRSGGPGHRARGCRQVPVYHRLIEQIQLVEGLILTQINKSDAHPQQPHRAVVAAFKGLGT